MGKSEFDIELRITKVICWSLIIMLFLGIFAEFVVRGQLINWEDPNLTFTNIKNSLTLFELGVFAFILIIILDVFLAISLYVLFNSIDKLNALLMVSLRLIYIAVKAFAIVGLFLAIEIYSSSVEVSLGQIDIAQAMQFLKMHHYGFGVGLIFFGLHLIFLAILLLKVKAIPKLISWTLLIAGIGYSLNSSVGFFATNFDFLENIVFAIFIIPMTFSELIFGIWLWVKRKKVIPLLKK